MPKVLFLVALILAPLVSMADGPWTAMAQDRFVNTAIANVQQVGEFYFIPLPIENNTGLSTEEKTGMAQIILFVLDEFQKRKDVSITSFTIERDFNVAVNRSKNIVHGIFVKAVPKK